MALQQTAIPRPPRPSSLADVLDLILDKGLVIDAYVRVSVIGIELVVVDARIVIASVDTYLRFAEAVNRLDLAQTKESTTYEDLVRGGSKEMGEGGTEGAIEGIKKEFGWGDGDGQGREEQGEESTEKKSKEQAGQARRAERIRSGGGGSRGSRGRSDDDEADDDGGDDDGGDDGGGGKGLLGKMADRARWSG
jgi:hypothetical protein